jgi:hypothetical protein
MLWFESISYHVSPSRYRDEGNEYFGGRKSEPLVPNTGIGQSEIDWYSSAVSSPSSGLFQYSWSSSTR